MSQDVRIRITGDASGLHRATQEAGRSLAGIADGARRMESSAVRASESTSAAIGRIGQAAAALAGVTLSVGNIAQAADAWQTLNAQLKIATGSAQAGAAAYGEVLRIATATGQSLETVSVVYRRFAENADALGISMAKVAGISETVAQAMALSGGSAESAQAALFQFGQALASGQLRGEELNSVLEQAPRLARALADGLNVPVGKLRALAEAGELTADKLVEALGKSAGNVAREFDELPITIGRAMQNLRTAFTDTVGSFEQSTGVFGGVARAIDGVAGNMDTLAAATGAVAAITTGKLVSALTAATAAKVSDALAAVRNQQASVAAAAASELFARAKLAEAQATVAAATGMQRLSAVQSALIPAQAALTAATAATTAAQSASLGVASLAGRALGALGGPIGLITTALSLGATAWMVWGDKTDAATARAAASAAEHLDSIIGKLSELNGRLSATSRSAFEGVVGNAERELRNLRSQTSALGNQLDALDGNGQRWSEEGRRLAAEFDVLARREVALQAQVAEARANSARVGIDSVRAFVAANATGAAKVRADQERVLAEFARAIEQTGGVLDLNIPEHTEALDTLNAKLAEIGKPKEKPQGKPKGGAPSESEQAREYRSALERLIDIQNSARAATEGLSAAQVVLNNAMQVPAGAMRDRLVQAAQQADAAQATQALAESLRNMDRAIIDAARGTMELDAAQTELYGLMTSPEWARLSEDERLRAVARAEEVSATLKLIEADRLLLEQRHKMRELADRYQGGGYGEVGSSDAMNAYSKDVGEALGNIPKANKEAADSFDDLKQSIEGWGRDSAQAMVDFALTGKSSFKDMISSMLADLARMAVYRMIMQPLFSSLTGMLPASALGDEAGEHGMQRFAKGGAFTNSIVSSPTLFKFANGTGLMGEAGPEAIMPLRRGPDGRLGVSAHGGSGGGGNVSVVINNHSGAPVEQRSVPDGRGGRRLEVTIGEMVAAEMRRQGSAMNSATRSSFGLQPALVGR